MEPGDLEATLEVALHLLDEDLISLCLGFVLVSAVVRGLAHAAERDLGHFDPLAA